MTDQLPAAYSAAQKALARAVKIEQAAHVAGVAEKMEALAIRAKDALLSGDAAELKVRATRKVGVLIKNEKAAGTLRQLGPDSLVIFDQPSFAKPIYIEGAHETWIATFKDYVICGCELVGEVRWAREALWQVDASGGRSVKPDLNRGRQLPPAYVRVDIVPPSDRLYTWANARVTADGYDPIPYVQ